MAASKISSWCTAIGSISPSMTRWEISGAHAVVAQPAGVDSGGHEAAAQGVHLDQRRQVRGVAEVVGVGALGHGRAGGGLDGDDARALVLSAQLATDERERDAGEVGAAAGAADDDVGPVVGQLELLDHLLADHGLVHEHVIQDAAEGVAGSPDPGPPARPPPRWRCPGSRCSWGPSPGSHARRRSPCWGWATPRLRTSPSWPCGRASGRSSRAP